MKIKPFLISFLLMGLSAIAFTQTAALNQKAIVLKRMVELNHYSPRAVNDSFSADLFRQFIKSTDARSIFFTAAEYKSLLAFEYKLDDELNGSGWKFYDFFIPLYKKALVRADSLITAATAKPFDFSVNDNVVSSKETTLIYNSELPAIANRWVRTLKYKLLLQLYSTASADTTGVTTIKSLLPKEEAATRERVKKLEKNFIDDLLSPAGGFENSLGDLFLNAIAVCFDPHTNYFSAKEKESFIEELSTEVQSFGVDWDEDEDGKVVADHLAPGGPAWKSGDLNKGDELLEIQFGKSASVNISGMDLDEVYELMDKHKDESITLKFKKTNGTIKSVELRKEKIDNEENIVKSFVLSGPKKIGYIMLPGFYTEWGSETGSSCANDVAKEIVKLKRENIEGLVLDLRFNGGGSLSEAMDLTGIFINEGPVAAIKEKAGKLIYLKDMNRGTIYDGPLAVMINPASASASEMVSASLQDYNRAIIVGGNSYGKATMQQILLMDTFKTKNTGIPDGKDAVKITNGKLYRLNGNTAQKQGVVPDIKFPDIMDAMKISEAYEKNALPADSTSKNSYYKPLKPISFSELASLSNQRINSSNYFKNIKKAISYIQQLNKEGAVTIPLRLDAFETWIKQREKDMEMIETDEAGIDSVAYKTGNHSMDKRWIERSEYSKSLNERWLKKLNKDLYLSETFLVLCDLINLSKTPN